MLDKLHDHILEELNTNTKTDIVFILSSILLNFISLGINSIFASGTGWDEIKDESYLVPSDYVIFWLVVILVFIVNAVVIMGLKRGKETRFRLLTGLVKMYKNQNVDEFYDTSNLESYNIRYTLFTIAVVSTGALAFLVPLILMIMD